MRVRYFAYGSNLYPGHMRRRIPSAAALGPALLRGMRLTFDKRGRDGSAKANLTEDRAAKVWGVVYTIERSHWALLDAVEAGYQRICVSVEQAGAAIGVETYASTLRAAEPIAFDWYKRLIVCGARAHELPQSWVARLERLPARVTCR